MVGKPRKGVAAKTEKVGNKRGQKCGSSPTRNTTEKRRAAAQVVPIGTRRPAPPKPATQAARRFLNWLREHDLCREWMVDDVWYLATDDFAEAHDVDLPPRRVFLGELQKLDGVRVTYDRRVRDRAGRVLRKTTFYNFTAENLAAEQMQMKLAA